MKGWRRIVQWFTWMFPGALIQPPESSESVEQSREAVVQAKVVVDRVHLLLQREAELEKLRSQQHGDTA